MIGVDVNSEKKTVYERKCHYENKTKEAKRFLLIQLMLKKTKLFNLRLLIDNKLSRNVNKKFQRKRIIAELHARARRA